MRKQQDAVLNPRAAARKCRKNDNNEISSANVRVMEKEL